MTRHHEPKPGEPHSADEPSNVQETPPPTGPRKRASPLASKMLEKAAYEQLAGPFGKLGRYVLKQQWGMTIPDGQEGLEGRTKKAKMTEAPKKGLFSRLLTFLRIKRH